MSLITSEGHDTILLHKEYPTIALYERLPSGQLKESGQGRRRGAFDISVWDPRFISQREHRKQKVLCAAELALNECSSGNLHTINDTLKLAGSTNEIGYGYLLFFVRDDPNYEKNSDQVWKYLEAASKKVRVAFALVDGKRKPKPKYLGFGVRPNDGDITQLL